MLGPAEKIYHKYNKVWIYVNGNVQKVLAVKVKPCELVSEEEDKEDKKETETEVVEEKEDEIIRDIEAARKDSKGCYWFKVYEG